MNPSRRSVRSPSTLQPRGNADRSNSSSTQETTIRPFPEEITRGPVGTTGCLVVGSEGTLSAGLWNTDCNVRLKGDTEFRGANLPAIAAIPRTQPRIDTEVLNGARSERHRGSVRGGARSITRTCSKWVLACAIEDVFPVQESRHGSLKSACSVCWPIRLQKPIFWDAAKRQAVGLPEADAIIDPQPSTNEYVAR